LAAYRTDDGVVRARGQRIEYRRPGVVSTGFDVVEESPSNCSGKAPQTTSGNPIPFT